jgi:hypothetical protein
MTEQLSPATGLEALNTLKDRIAATTPLRTRAITLADAARRGIEVAGFLALPAVASRLSGLEAAGLPSGLANDLRLASHALFHRASLREHVTPTAPSAARVSVELWDAVTTLRRDLLDALTFGLRANPQVQEVLARVRSGGGYLDNAQDLATLGLLASEHADFLKASMPGHFDASMADRAAARSSAMLEALGVKADDAIDDADQRLWGLFVALYNEARAALAFVWRAEPERLERVSPLAGKRAAASPARPATPAGPSAPTE